MKKYKPEYLGKILPVDEPEKLNDFVVNKFDAFSKVYDLIKNSSEDIDNITMIDDNRKDSISINISTNENNILENINSDDNSIIISENIITVTI